MDSIFKNRTIASDSTLIEAFKKMDSIDKKLLIVTQSKMFCGLLSAGDIQRAIINNKPLNTPINEILRKEFRVASKNDSFEKIKQMMLYYRMELCPVVDENNEIDKVYFWEDIFTETFKKPSSSFNIPVVVMAGGLGTRLRPLTNIIPKPLIPIGEKTIIEEIFNRFEVYGCDKFYISVNYKAELIEFYLKQLNLKFELSFFKEDIPLGTAGSLSLLKGILKETFFVSNCDIIIEQDYSEILNYHKHNNNVITIISAIKSYPISYGTIETGKNGQLIRLVEKPELTFQINSGMYILEPHILNEIPEMKLYHITQLIEDVIKKGYPVGVFPVSEKSWRDFGEWNEYIKTWN